MFENIKNIDTDEGLERVGDDVEFYKELLLSLKNDYSNSMVDYRLFIKKNDLEGARRLIHTIKGVSGNLGAKALHVAAKNLEDGIKSGSITAVMEDTLEVALNGVLQDLELINFSKPPFDIANTKSLLSDLVALEGTRSTMACKNIIDNLNSFSYSGDIESLMQDILASGSRYKFEDSIASAKELLLIIY